MCTTLITGSMFGRLVGGKDKKQNPPDGDGPAPPSNPPAHHGDNPLPFAEVNHYDDSESDG